MRYILAILYGFLNLAGCTDTQNRIMVVTTQENGVVTLDSRTEVKLGRARFACEAATGGRCFYTVFDGGKLVRAFALDAHEERLIDHLPAGFTQCVAVGPGVSRPDCARAT